MNAVVSNNSETNLFSYNEIWVDGLSRKQRNCGVPAKIRFLYYAKKAVSQGAFFPLEELLARFQKASKNHFKERHRYRIRKYFCDNAYKFNLKTLYLPGKRGKRLYVCSESDSHLNAKYDVIIAISAKIKAQIHANAGKSVELYEALGKLESKSRSSLERVARKIKIRARELGLYIFKKGRVLEVRLRSRRSSKNTHQNPDTYFYKGNKAKDVNINTPCGDARLISRIRKKAFWLARELKGYFWDNAKVKYNPRMAFRYVEWALCSGFDEKSIRGAFSEALTQRHKDATDMGLSQGCHWMKFELSSTVSMAKRILESDSQSIKARWIMTVKQIKERKNSVEQKTNRYQEFGECVPIVNSLKEVPKISENSFRNNALESGYSERQIDMYEKYKRKELPGGLIINYQFLLRRLFLLENSIK